MQDRKEVMKRWCGVMEWLDRLGYLTAASVYSCSACSSLHMPGTSS
jgi:hypothetical protein